MLHTKPYTVWIGINQIRGSVFKMFLQPKKKLACVHFITDSTRVSDVLRFIIHTTQYLNDNLTKFGHQRTPDAPSKLRKLKSETPFE